MSNEATFPFEIQEICSNLPHNTVHDEAIPVVRIGPEGYYMPKYYLTLAADIYNLQLRSNDVFVVTVPRSGTTWTQELVWLVANDLDYTTALATPLTKRYRFLELPMIFTEKSKQKLIKDGKQDVLDELEFAKIDDINHTTTKRFFKTHVPLSFLPPNVLDVAKVVYIARDPRDVAVSMYHHTTMTKFTNDKQFKSFWKLFVDGLIYSTPYFAHVKEAWNKRHHPNLLFLFYEELLQDLPAAIRRVADFFGKKLNEADISALNEHLSFDNFKKNNAVNKDFTESMGLSDSDKFVRKGKSGGWRNYFDEELSSQAVQWVTDNVRDTGLQYPVIS